MKDTILENIVEPYFASKGSLGPAWMAAIAPWWMLSDCSLLLTWGRHLAPWAFTMSINLVPNIYRASTLYLYKLESVIIYRSLKDLWLYVNLKLFTTWRLQSRRGGDLYLHLTLSFSAHVHISPLVEANSPNCYDQILCVCVRIIMTISEMSNY